MVYDIEDQGYTREAYADINILQQNEPRYSRRLTYLPDLLEKFICYLYKHNII